MGVESHLILGERREGGGLRRKEGRRARQGVADIEGLLEVAPQRPSASSDKRNLCINLITAALWTINAADG